MLFIKKSIRPIIVIVSLIIQNKTNEVNKTSSIPTSCVLLGGFWKLNPMNENQIALGSKVEILTPDKQTQILYYEELSSLREKWIKKNSQKTQP